MTQTWNENLLNCLIEKYGKKQGTMLSARYSEAFPSHYLQEHSISDIADDILFIEKLSEKNPLYINLSSSVDNPEYPLHLKLFQFNKPYPLSDTLPILENMDLKTFDERLFRISLPDASTIWISDLNVKYTKASILNLATVKQSFQEAFIAISLNTCENDGFNKLVLGAELGWREIIILRAYTKYLRQIGFRFSQSYIEQALVNNTAVTRDLVQLFLIKFNPQKKSSSVLEKLEAHILQTLDSIISLDEDRIIRQIYCLIKATLRTNYFQTTTTDEAKSYLCFKLESKDIPEMPLPIPLYEIFVYALRFEGIHLRSAKVARGGIRWSDRREDFRTEILGLMKAQKVKNAIIVPSGAKGGFVLKSLPANASRDATMAEVINCYKAFISALLDLTDNYKNKSIVKPINCICYDEDDPYLVVAADKGTAAFSDIANKLAQDYKFWLGDAFASGGSTGYDHKKMGITARGAWESIKRHFSELDLNIDSTEITVIGIGDMSGDVFGNGMIYSTQLKLVGAFDHRHIFIDPNPNTSTSYTERMRLFSLPTSAWTDYNPKLISKGGGVFSRTSKTIALTSEIKKLLAITDNALSPNELIKAMLCAPVDLLYNGGIGTYVKASTENQAEVGDKTNEFCRVNGNELRCRVVGEGGNLGFTQLGRVEYALTGGLINTDFIDNSGGVDCSDHEVNIKILLNQEVDKGHLTEKQRNQLLTKMTNEVAALVLKDNYNQALVMSFSAFHAVKYLGLYQDYIKELETLGEVNRRVEFLPDDKKILERKSSGLGLTRPELAILLAYTKIHIKNEILKSDLPEDPYLSKIIETAFPEKLQKSFLSPMLQHRLRREIIATQLSNRIVNKMGITFVYRVQIETGASIPEIIRAQAIAAEVFEATKLRNLIDSLHSKVSIKTQYELLHHIRHLLNLATRWFLRHKSLQHNIESIITQFSGHIKKLTDIIPKLMSGTTKEYLAALTNQFQQAGLSKDSAKRIATTRAMYTALNVTETAAQNNFDLTKTAEVYFAVGEHFKLVWFRDQIASDAREGHWNTIARLALRDDLDVLQKKLTEVIITFNKKETNAHKLILLWKSQHKAALERWEKILALLSSSPSTEYTMFFISLRELTALIRISEMN